MRQSYTSIPEKDLLRYCETVVELRPEFLEVRLSLNNKNRCSVKQIVFIDSYTYIPTNVVQNSFFKSIISNYL